MVGRTSFESGSASSCGRRLSIAFASRLAVETGQNVTHGFRNCIAGASESGSRLPSKQTDLEQGSMLSIITIKSNFAAFGTVYRFVFSVCVWLAKVGGSLPMSVCLDVVQSSASVAAISVLFCTGWAAFGRPAAPKLDWKSSHHIVQT